jgi:hypothetical protein
MDTVAKRKTTIYVDEDLLRGAKILAARTGKKDYEVLEDALRSHLGLETVARVRGSADVDEAEGLRLAYEAVEATRPAPG